MPFLRSPIRMSISIDIRYRTAHVHHSIISLVILPKLWSVLNMIIAAPCVITWPCPALGSGLLLLPWYMCRSHSLGCVRARCYFFVNHTGSYIVLYLHVEEFTHYIGWHGFQVQVAEVAGGDVAAGAWGFSLGPFDFLCDIVAVLDWTTVPELGCNVAACVSIVIARIVISRTWSTPAVVISICKSLLGWRPLRCAGVFHGWENVDSHLV